MQLLIFSVLCLATGSCLQNVTSTSGVIPNSACSYLIEAPGQGYQIQIELQQIAQVTSEVRTQAFAVYDGGK